jgi:hypothetical protein
MMEVNVSTDVTKEAIGRLSANVSGISVKLMTWLIKELLKEGYSVAKVEDEHAALLYAEFIDHIIPEREDRGED